MSCLRRCLYLVTCVYLLAAITACGGDSYSESQNLLSPIIFVPGYGMGALHVEVTGDRAEEVNFNFLLPAMNPDNFFMPPIQNAADYAQHSGLPAGDLTLVREWLKLEIAEDGSARSRKGVRVRPVSIGKNFSEECPRYVEMMGTLAAEGWEPNRNLKCIPYDYRFPPGETAFVKDLERLLEDTVAAANGTKATIACHSQGCLLVYHFLRTQDPVWLEEHVGLFFALAGQFSGCSDCLRWSFQKEWSWNPNDGLASPSDMTWTGELALGLQTSVYQDNVLYQWGSQEYGAAHTLRLLRDAGALDIARATERYALERQAWFQEGAEEHKPLSVPTRMTYGTDLPTQVGFIFEQYLPADPTCTHPTCGELYHQNYPGVIEAEGDTGESGWMTRAPQAWLEDPTCEIRELLYVEHMDIFNNADALDFLVTSARDVLLGVDSCW
mgnify:FL=1